MAKLPRIFYKLFGASGPTDDFAEFGSQTAGTPIKTKDISLIQSLGAYDTGWKDAIIAANRAPFLEDMNALFLVKSYMLNYLFQEGIPEYDVNTTYYTGSIVKKAGTSDLYESLIDNNVANALPVVRDGNWSLLGERYAPISSIKDYAGSAAPLGWIFCDGSAVSRATYSRLFSVIGTDYGPGDGVTTFNVPDLRGRASIGVGQGAGLTDRLLAASGGTETHTHSTPAIPTHVHDTEIYATDGDVNHGLYVNRFPAIGAGQSKTYIQVVGPGGIISGIVLKYPLQTQAGGSVGAGTTGAGSSMQPFLVLNKIIKY